MAVEILVDGWPFIRLLERVGSVEAVFRGEACLEEPVPWPALPLADSPRRPRRAGYSVLS